MSMDVMAVAAAALDEAIGEQGELAQAVVQDAAKGGDATKNRNAAQTNGGQQLFDLAAHDRARHPGGFHPENGNTCKFRDKMAETMASMGMLQKDSPIAQALGEQAVNKGLVAAGKANADGNVDDGLLRIRELNTRRKRIDKTKDHDAYEKACSELNAARDEYLKQKLGEVECGAVDQLVEKAKNPSLREKVKAVVGKIREMIERSKGSGTANETTSAQEVAVEKIEEQGLTDGDEQRLPSEEPTPSELISEFLDVRQRDGETDAAYARRLQQAVFDTHRKLSGLGMEDQEREQIYGELNARIDEENARLAENHERKNREDEERRSQLRKEWIERATSPERMRQTAEENYNADVDAIIADNERDDDAKLAAINERKEKFERELKSIRRRELESQSPASGGETSKPSDVRRNANGSVELDVGGKTYVDLSDVSPDDQVKVLLSGSNEGKEFITRFGDNRRRWEEVTSQIPQFKDKMEALQSAVSSVMLTREFDLAAAMTDDKQAEASIEELKREYENAGKESERKAIRAELAKVCAEYGIGSSNATQMASAKLAAEKSKERRAEEKNARDAEKARNDERRRDEAHRLGVSVKQAALARSGILPDGVSPNSELGKIAAMQKEKIENATEKSRIALEKAKGTQLQTTYAESDPSFIALMEKTADEMDASGDDVLRARAAQIRNTLINTLRQTHDGTDAYNAVHKFKKLLGVNDDVGGRTADAGRETVNFNVSGVDHKSGGIVSGSAKTWTTANDAKIKLDDVKAVNGIPDKLEAKKDALGRIIGQFGLSKADVKTEPHTTYTALSFPVKTPPSQAELDSVKNNMLYEIKHNMGYQQGQYDVAAAGVSVYYDGVDREIKVRLNNDTQTTIPFKDFVSSPSYKNAIDKNPYGVVVPAGVNENGSPMYLHLSSSGGMPHLTICGKTGSGKGMSARAIVGAIMSNYSPNQVKLAIADPKLAGGVSADYGAANGSEFMVHDVVGANDIPSLLKWARKEHDNRMAIIARAGFKNLDEYNKAMGDKVDANGKRLAIPDIVMPIDEFSNLMKQNGKSTTTNAVEDLAEIARSTGIHLLLITQRPDSKTLTGKIASAAPDIMCHQLNNDSDSSVSMLKGMHVKGQTGRGSFVYRGWYIDQDGNRRQTPPEGISGQAVTIGNSDIGTLAKYDGGGVQSQQTNPV